MGTIPGTRIIEQGLVHRETLRHISYCDDLLNLLVIQITELKKEGREGDK